MKRFTCTQKWSDPWFRKLSGPAKMLWYYLIDHCDNIGLVEIDLGLVSADTGITIESKHLFELSDRIQQLDSGKLFLPKFISFQYGRLSPQCPAHKRVIEAIERHGIVEDGNTYSYPNARVGLPKKIRQDSNTLDLVEVQEGKKPTGYSDEVETLWSMFPATSRNRSSKKKLSDELAKAKDRPALPSLVASVASWASSWDWVKDGGAYAPGAHLWAKERKWESEPVKSPKKPQTRPINEQFSFQRNGFTKRPFD